MAAGHETEPDRNSVLGKVAAILAAFGPDEASVSLATIVRRSGVTKPSAHRLLTELVAIRLVDRTDDGYRLGRKLFALGMAAPEPQALRRAAQPAMQDLAGRTGGTVALAILDQDSVLCVESVGDAVDRSLSPGAHSPAQDSALGRVLLAFAGQQVRDGFLRGLRAPAPSPGSPSPGSPAPGLRTVQHLARELDRIAIEGVAHDGRDPVSGTTTTACPVRDDRGAVIAAVSVSISVSRIPATGIAGLVSATAEVIARALAEVDGAAPRRPGAVPAPRRVPRPVRRVRVATMPYVDTAPLWVAAQEGIFARHGLQITLVPVNGPGQTPRLLATSQADLGVTTTPNLVTAVDDGLALRAVAGLSLNTLENPRLFLVAGTGSGITDPAGLAGRRIGVSSQRGYLRVGSDALLRRLGVDTTAIEWVPMDLGQMRANLSAGVVDAVAAPLPLPLLLQRDGGRIVLNLAELGASTLDVFVAGRADWIAANRSVTESFRSALHDGIRLLDREPELAVRAQTRFARLSPELSAAVTVGTYIDAPMPEQLEFWIELMGSAHLIGHPIAAESLIAR
ncbi:ABC transporter substrate-binding protein [Pseudonocardia acidicola]|uniref:ABC transporter substrate-binding protein n=1 Tax=Pseudonocardia acidicola TaxID=2724939 RepID=A0ABX1SKY2_9PSEU|nr:ABC transporter substrate-binding protein [Pseudonocardia acidicola]